MTWMYAVSWGVAGLAAGWSTDRVVRRVTSWGPVGLASTCASAWMLVDLLGGGAPALLLTWWCACLMCTDVGTRRLPNGLTAAGAVGVLTYAAATGEVPAVIIGGGALFACYLVVHLAMPRAFGAGDVKLAFALGGITGPAGSQWWVLAALAAPALTGVVGLVLRVLGGPESTVPHGPSMCLATLLASAAAAT